jgi:hypothetical protein
MGLLKLNQVRREDLYVQQHSVLSADFRHLSQSVVQTLDEQDVSVWLQVRASRSLMHPHCSHRHRSITHTFLLHAHAEAPEWVRSPTCHGHLPQLSDLLEDTGDD